MSMHGDTAADGQVVTCPTARLAPDGTPHTVIGCGSTRVVEDPTEPGLYDCLDCGIFFTPALERAAARTKVGDGMA